MQIHGADVVPSEAVRNLGVHLDSRLTLEEHVRSKLLRHTSCSQRGNDNDNNSEFGRASHSA